MEHTARFMATTSLDPAPAAPDEQFAQEEVLGYTRSASDLLRLLVYLLLALALLAVTRWAQDSVLSFEADLVSLLNFLEPPAERVLEGVAQVLALIVSIGVLATPFVLKRYRMFWYLVAANVLSGLLVNASVTWLDRDAPPAVANEIARARACTSSRPCRRRRSHHWRRRS